MVNLCPNRCALAFALRLLFPSRAGFPYNEGVMQGPLLEPDMDTGNPPPAVPSLAQLHQELAALRAEVAGLRRDNLELRQQAGYWKGMHAQACRRLAELEQEHEHLRGENRKLQAQAFGRKSEQQ